MSGSRGNREMTFIIGKVHMCYKLHYTHARTQSMCNMYIPLYFFILTETGKRKKIGGEETRKRIQTLIKTSRKFIQKETLILIAVFNLLNANSSKE